MQTVKKGIALIDEHKEKLRSAKLGKKRGSLSEEHKNNIRIANTRFVWDKDRRRAQGERMKGTALHKGYRHSEETKEKIRQASLKQQEQKRLFNRLEDNNG